MKLSHGSLSLISGRTDAAFKHCLPIACRIIRAPYERPFQKP
jgi:hypothetical protein